MTDEGRFGEMMVVKEDLGEEEIMAMRNLTKKHCYKNGGIYETGY